MMLMMILIIMLMIMLTMMLMMLLMMMLLTMMAFMINKIIIEGVIPLINLVSTYISFSIDKLSVSSCDNYKELTDHTQNT